MSRPVHSYLKGLFGSASGADCRIRFQTTGPEDPAPRYIGETLPAHQLVLRGGSERFRAQLERWTPQASAGDTSRAAKKPRVEDSSPESWFARVVVPQSFPRDAPLPELAVPLGSEGELEAAIAAIRFMYTGKVVQPGEPQGAQGGQQGASHGSNDTRSDCSMRTLLLIRSQAEYLQVQGCAEACDAALVARLAEADDVSEEASGEESDADSDEGDSSGSAASHLAPLLELYSCRQLLPSPEEDPRAGAILDTCCQHLQRHWDSELPARVAGLARPSKLKLLAWLLGDGNAVRIANDPQLLQRWLALPTDVLEELLQSDHLSTDDEGTVVVLVEKWVAAKGSGVTAAGKASVRAQLRLVNCSPSYLFDVLPKLPVLGPKAAQQAAFLARCQLTDRSEWERMGRRLGGYDMSSPRYGKARRQSVPTLGVPFRWEISRDELLAALRVEGSGFKGVLCRFRHAGGLSAGDSFSVVALGCEWQVVVKHKLGQPCASMYLRCRVPTAYGAHGRKVQGGVRASASVRVSVEGSQPCTMRLPVSHIPYGESSGRPGCLPLEAAQPAAEQQEQAADDMGAPGTDANLLAPWAKLLGSGGKLSGTVRIGTPQ